MEDFVRELKAATGLYLIYGEPGVGKSRLLEELVQTRLAESKVRWMDLQAGSSGDGALVDSSVMIEKVFARARPGDIIVADHFEMALKKTRHQLFLSWSTDGIDKQLNLIVASNTDFFNELRQLAQQYQVRIQSFQQMPFSADEASAFLGFYMFPGRSGVKLSVPGILRNQLAMAQGNVGKIVEIAERAGDQITSEMEIEAAPEPADSRSFAVLLVTIPVLAILGGIGWYLLYAQPGADWDNFFAPADSIEIDQSTPAKALSTESAGASPAVISAPVAEAVSTPEESSAENAGVSDAVDDNQVEPVSCEVEQGAGELAPTPAPTPAPESAAEIVIVTSTTAVDEYAGPATTDTDSDTTQPDEAEPDQSAGETALAISAEVDAQKASAASVASPGSSTGSGSDRLTRDLQISKEWIDSQEAQVGTLQIMFLRQLRFDEESYYDYIDRLGRQGVDTSRIRILETLTGNQKVFSVVYGEYQSRGAAGLAESDLPVILRKASPIPRSVGALKQEMRRLEGQN